MLTQYLLESLHDIDTVRSRKHLYTLFRRQRKQQCQEMFNSLMVKPVFDFINQ